MTGFNRIILFLFVFCVLPGLAGTVTHAAPLNDNFIDATILSGNTGTANATNIEATAEPGEPNHGDSGISAYASIWFSWTAPSSGQIFFNTSGSNFDTTLAAYTGITVDALTKLAENDDSGLNFQSQISFSAVAGTTYYIAVDGYDESEQGSVILNWIPAAENDNFADATVISGSAGTVKGINVDATAEPGEPNHGDGGTTAYVSIWFSWTAATSGQIFFNTFGSNFDTTLAAYTGITVDDLTKLAENDDSGQDFQSRIGFPTVAGTTYYIAVDGYDATEQGSVILNWMPAAENDNFADATVISGSAGTVNGININASAEPGEPNHGDGGTTAYASIWFSWTAAASGQIIFDTYGSNFDTTLAAYTGTTVDDLTKLAENDDSWTNYQSRIVFSTVADTTYFIAVDGYDETELGNVILHFNFKPKFPWLPFLPAMLSTAKP